MKIAVIFIFLIFNGGPIGSAEAPKESTDQLVEEGKALDQAWLNQKREFLKKYEDLIKRTGKSIKEHHSALDHGDPAQRGKINEEKSRLEQSRNKLKRKLGEFTA